MKFVKAFLLIALTVYIVLLISLVFAFGIWFGC